MRYFMLQRRSTGGLLFFDALQFVRRQVGAGNETRRIGMFNGFGHFILDIIRGWRVWCSLRGIGGIAVIAFHGLHPSHALQLSQPPIALSVPWLGCAV
jgi:hypothetical protein